MITLKSQQQTCHNPDHCHANPVIHIVDITTERHQVHIEQDGETFNVFIDDDLAGQIGLRSQQVYDLLQGLSQ